MFVHAHMAPFVAVLSLAPSVVRAQAVAPPINPAPLEHPQSLITLQTSDVPRLFSMIRRAVGRAGFEMGRVDGARYVVDAHQPKAPAKDFDRIIVWLERSPLDPAQSVDLYLAYGRYAEILTQDGKGTHRVVVDQTFEDQHVGPVRQALLQLADSI